MITHEVAQVANLLDAIEMAVGEIMPRHEPNAGPITAIIQAVNGLRAALGIAPPRH